MILMKLSLLESILGCSMKDSLRGRKLDHMYTISRMNAMEKIAYDLIYKDTEFKSKDWTSTIDAFIEDCIAAELITREHLYYPKR